MEYSQNVPLIDYSRLYRLFTQCSMPLAAPMLQY